MNGQLSFEEWMAQKHGAIPQQKSMLDIPKMVESMLPWGRQEKQEQSFDDWMGQKYLGEKPPIIEQPLQVQEPQEARPSGIERVGKDILGGFKEAGEHAIGLGEAAVSGASGLIAFAPAFAAGLLKKTVGGERGKGAVKGAVRGPVGLFAPSLVSNFIRGSAGKDVSWEEANEFKGKVASLLTHEPKTEKGKMYTDVAMSPFGALGAGVEQLEKLSPETPGMMTFVAEALLLFGGPKVHKWVKENKPIYIKKANELIKRSKAPPEVKIKVAEVAEPMVEPLPPGVKVPEAQGQIIKAIEEIKEEVLPKRETPIKAPELKVDILKEKVDISRIEKHQSVLDDMKGYRKELVEKEMMSREGYGPPINYTGEIKQLDLDITQLEHMIKKAKEHEITGKAPTTEEFLVPEKEKIINIKPEPEVKMIESGRPMLKWEDQLREGEPTIETIVKGTDQKVIEGAITEKSAKLAKQYPEPEPKLEYKHAGLDLRTELNQLGVPTEVLTKELKDLHNYFRSPDKVLAKDPYGKKIAKDLLAADLEGNRWLHEQYIEYNSRVSKKIKKDSPEDTVIFKIRDNDLNINELTKMDEGTVAEWGITPEELTALKKNPGAIKSADAFYEKKFGYLLRRWGKSLLDEKAEAKIWKNSKKGVSTKWVENLSDVEKEVFNIYSKKISRYITHIIDRSELIDYATKELQTLNKKMTRINPDSPEFTQLDAQRTQLLHTIDVSKGKDPVLYDALPGKIRFGFFEKRKGAPGYNISARRAYETYLGGIKRKIFDDPAIRGSIQHYKGMSPELRPYAKWYMQRFMGIDKKPFQALSGTIRSAEWMLKLGGNPRSSVVNLTQQLNTLADYGPINAARGYKFAMTKEGRQLFESTGIPETVMQVMASDRPSHPKIESLRAGVGWLFNKVEYGNRLHAFCTGYQAAIRKRMPQAKAITEGIKSVERNQFMYGRVGMPKALTGAPGVAFQFWSFPIKQIELMSYWIRKKPASFVTWLALAEGGKVALDELLGLDLSSALGLGIDYGELINTVAAFTEGEGKKAKFHLKQISKGGGVAPYGLGPAVNLFESIGKALKGEVAPEEVMYKQLTPVAFQRGMQSGKALAEGPDTEGKYPVRKQPTGELQYRETPEQLAARVLVAKPSIETKEQQEIQKIRLTKKMYTETQRKISDLIAAGKVKQALELATKYKIQLSKQSVTAAMKRRAFTARERALMNKAESMKLFEEYLNQ